MYFVVRVEDLYTSDLDNYIEDESNFVQEGEKMVLHDESVEGARNDIHIEDSWQEICDGMKNIPFTGTNRLLVEPPGDEPYDWFRMLVDDEFLETIVTECNNYAVEVLSTSNGSNRSRITEWKELTVKEFLVFLGLTLHTGTIKLPEIQDYWKKDRLLTTCFSNYMSRDRYLLIMRCLHFSKTWKEGDEIPEDRLFKIKPVVDYFNNVMRKVYSPKKQLSLDESMVLWKGRLIFRQYLPNKRHKYGVKLYMVTEPDGLILKFVVCGGQHDVLGGKDHVKKIVMHLLSDYLDQGHSIFMDNFYNSFDLAKMLLARNTYCTGTLRKGRKGSANDVICAKLKKGESKAMYLDHILIGKWRDKREVIYISSEFENDMTTVMSRNGIEKEKPLPIAMYNKYMGGVDKQDQLMAYYPVIRKTLRWYKKLAIHIFQLLLINSHILYNKYHEKMTLSRFRMSVIANLLPEPQQVKKTKPVDHMLSKITATNEKGHTMRKRCRICTRKKLRKDTLFHCLACPDNPGLCMGICFAEYHK